MPWKGVTVSKERQRFIEDRKLNYHSVTEVAERFGISRNTAHKWISRHEDNGQGGLPPTWPAKDLGGNLSRSVARLEADGSHLWRSGTAPWTTRRASRVMPVAPALDCAAEPSA